MATHLLPAFLEVIEQAPDAIVLVDPDGLVVYANPRVRALFGFEPDALIGQPVERLIPSRLRDQHMTHRLRYTREPRVRPMGDASVALAGLRADGTELPVDIHLSPIVSNGHRWTLAVIRDATERHRLMDGLREAGRTAERIARVKGEFLAMAAHDLSQPEQTLDLVIGTIERSVAPGSEIAQLAALASSSLARMRELLRMLGEISRLESESVQVIEEPVGVPEIYAYLERQFRPVAQAKALRFTSEPCPYVVETDPTLLRGMLSNLVSNAIRYTPQGAVVLRCLASPEGGLRLAVSDTGIGIPSDQVRTIFEDFSRLEAARDVHREGFGLGLGIVRRLSDLLGLPVEVESSVGHGSTFCVSIPPAKVHRLPA
ncbi:MAG TPA: PAS domain-containing sensor histidine kinase [Steroidobacteraceae bacterium]|nr:PAS domain-containing sensor histidine kinase [Steroidobacteraceae bacterium]